jgi:hypothetical protein
VKESRPSGRLFLFQVCKPVRAVLNGMVKDRLLDDCLADAACGAYAPTAPLQVRTRRRDGFGNGLFVARWTTQGGFGQDTLDHGLGHAFAAHVMMRQLCAAYGLDVDPARDRIRGRGIGTSLALVHVDL